MGTPDFSVDHEALGECGRKLDRAGDDLEAAGGRFRGPPDFDRDHFGDYGVPEAAGNFFTSWQDEWRLDVRALRELAEKVRRSAENYRSTDAEVAGAAGRPHG
ncbi:excreted virulence factor EspC (type VII ESX diderm) [Kitasatospora cineracea]|uniref:Excreted virulence factor EspC (Type VII ESX diderm) n=1 Tax=Kitasatospora cineracea TaxID=88074 RepID=A0A3N4RUT4_9ACTN|nr:excreted virulence factor EspC (type VII ESX diderm) [Kitasatospora cineracea]RPE34801.1 excreted virulence factor EspC (type VII ESX diderm) [Kitasatospora cineracea]